METCSDNHKRSSSGVAGSVLSQPDPSGSTFPPSGDSTRIFSQGNVKAPAFQFYASDFIGGTMQFTAEETGVYIRLLCYQWMNGGLPNDKNRIRSIAGYTKDPGSLTMPLAKFILGTDGVYRNKRLEEVRTAQDDFRRRQSVNGKAGAQARYGTAIAPPCHSHSQKDGDGIALRTPSPSPTPTQSPSSDSVGASGSRLASVCDDEWINGLVSNPAYEGIDVKRELGKMNTWCASHQKKPTRKRFVNWLNRCDPPMKGTNANHAGTNTKSDGKGIQPDYSAPW